MMAASAGISKGAGVFALVTLNDAFLSAAMTELALALAPSAGAAPVGVVVPLNEAVKEVRGGMTELPSSSCMCSRVEGCRGSGERAGRGVSARR